MKGNKMGATNEVKPKMEPVKPEPGKPDDKQEQLVVFGTNRTGLPAAVQKAIERHGMKTKELAGVAPTWKPLDPGTWILGEVLAVRHEVGEFGSTVVVLGTEDGPQSVWLGADLKTKFGDNVAAGQIYCIVYEGKLTKKENPKLKNDMHLYKVVEILPAEK